MNVKKLSVVLMMFLILIFSGCSEKQYITKTVEVKVPVKCITPTVKCNIQKRTYTERVQDLVDCIDRYKKSNEVCK